MRMRGCGFWVRSRTILRRVTPAVGTEISRGGQVGRLERHFPDIILPVVVLVHRFSEASGG